MYDKELALEILNQVNQAIQIITQRFQPIKSPEHFTNSPSGMEKLDAICMQLIVIGESLKNFEKITNKEILKKYPEIEWKKVIGMRDIITHHYFDINAYAIFDICENKLDSLKKTIEKIMQDMQNGVV